jgi:DNA-binding NtrC family response regulator
MTYAVIVDDEREWRELIGQALADAGCEVRAFGNGWRALEDMERRRPDVALLDVRMKPSGGEVLREVRHRWPSMPVIMVSSYWGHAEDPDVMRASAFVRKKLDIGGLSEDLVRILVRIRR